MQGNFSGKRRSLLKGALSSLFLGAASTAARAGESLWTTYQTPEQFLAEAFGASVPPPKVLDLDANGQAKVSEVFGKPYSVGKRLRYWKAGGKSAWILEDIGKQGYQITTAGFVVKAGAVDAARVLVYRESRGEQVAEASFLKQLAGAKLAGANLDRKVDNISGATLSVQMMQRLARLALRLDSLSPP